MRENCIYHICPNILTQAEKTWSDSSNWTGVTQRVSKVKI